MTNEYKILVENLNARSNLVDLVVDEADDITENTVYTNADTKVTALRPVFRMNRDHQCL